MDREELLRALLGVSRNQNTVRMPLGGTVFGNIDMSKRPHVPVPGGGHASVRSMSFGTPEGEVLVPTVSDDGRLLSDEAAISQYRRTGRHLGIFSSPKHATLFGEQLHQREAARGRR